VERGVRSVTLNGMGVPGACVSYDVGRKVLSMTGLNNATIGGAWKNDWVIRWN